MTDDAAAWRASGLAWLTGLPDGAADVSRAAVLARADAVTARWSALTGTAASASELLTGRAGLLGLTRRGRVSAGGATRLLRATDGWWALTLSRPDDVAAVPALVETDHATDDSWADVARWAAGTTVTDAVARARLLDLPCAALGEAAPAAPVVRAAGERHAPCRPVGLLVVDLSSMWAGPSCAQLLRRAGATVVKVESPGRPDGTRRGPRAVFDWLNHGKLCCTASFDDVDAMRALLSAADVVVESSKPSALRRRGLGPDDVAGRPGRVWVTITGHAAEGRVAFGDDAAVAAGLVGRSAAGPVFCADAIADPLTGLHAAVAVAESLHRGGGEEIRVAMSAVAATYAALPETADDGRADARPPVPPPPAPPASALDGDWSAVRRLLDERRCPTC
ncbi:CoA transferase [Mycolicibacterium grossiae]|nr:CoA transferase [Mycolicibacterium grossiae]QEM44342.1 CoA transferase [Mycolicibacterium grossiae]